MNRIDLRCKYLDALQQHLRHQVSFAVNEGYCDVDFVAGSQEARVGMSFVCTEREDTHPLGNRSGSTIRRIGLVKRNADLTRLDRDRGTFWIGRQRPLQDVDRVLVLPRFGVDDPQLDILRHRVGHLFGDIKSDPADNRFRPWRQFDGTPLLTIIGTDGNCLHLGLGRRPHFTQLRQLS